MVHPISTMYPHSIKYIKTISWFTKFTHNWSPVKTGTHLYIQKGFLHLDDGIHLYIHHIVVQQHQLYKHIVQYQGHTRVIQKLFQECYTHMLQAQINISLLNMNSNEIIPNLTTLFWQ